MIVAVTPVPIEPEPPLAEVTFRRSVPPDILTLLLFPSDGAPASSSVPPPDFVNVPPPLVPGLAAKTTLPAKLVMVD